MIILLTKIDDKTNMEKKNTPYVNGQNENFLNMCQNENYSIFEDQKYTLFKYFWNKTMFVQII